jgi:hypothetical protein
LSINNNYLRKVDDDDDEKEEGPSEIRQSPEEK